MIFKYAVQFMERQHSHILSCVDKILHVAAELDA